MSIKVSCSQCNAEIVVTPSRFENRINFFCSRKCESEFKKSKPNVQCKICGNEFHIKPYMLKKMKDPSNVCCSRKCGAKLKESTMIGKNNHQFGLLGELNSSYLQDWKTSDYGYIQVRNINHPFRDNKGFVLFHRLVIEEFLRTNDICNEYLVEVEGYDDLFLNPFVDVHHKNLNKLDNLIDNLRINEYIRDEVNGRFIKGCGKMKSPNKNIRQLFKKNVGDAGLDICSNEESIIKGNSSKLITTGLYISIPENCVGLIWSRSGLSVKSKIEVGAGCIDSGYRGEILIHLYNFGEEDFKIMPGDRIAQLLTIPINLNFYDEVDELDNTDRGQSGFGSTGTK